MTFYHVYADESRQNAHRHMLFGALFVPRGQVENNFLSDIASLRTRNHMSGEMKWGKISRGFLPLYKEYVDVFFAHPAIEFRCLVVDTDRIDYAAHHQNDTEVAFYNFYGLMLSRNLAADNRHLIFTDERSNRERNRLSDLKTAINSYWTGKGVGENIVSNIEPRISKYCEPLQVTDILLGAVGYAIEEYSTSEPRMAMIEHITQRLGATNLREHRGRNTRFNTWVLDFDKANQNAMEKAALIPDPVEPATSPLG